MTKLMQQHDKKQRQVLQNIPAGRGITIRSPVDFDYRDYKPGPMQKDVNPADAEQADRALAGAEHARL